jgi:hypothetical protein
MVIISMAVKGVGSASSIRLLTFDQRYRVVSTFSPCSAGHFTANEGAIIIPARLSIRVGFEYTGTGLAHKLSASFGLCMRKWSFGETVQLQFDR